MKYLLLLLMISCASPVHYTTDAERAERQKVREEKRISDINLLVKENPKMKRFKQHALDKKVRIGMSKELLHLSKGITKGNWSSGSWGTHIQYVYDDYYVYVENGFVTSWQSK